jgi:DNA modification methylase
VNFHLSMGDALACQGEWPDPTVIVVDGPYGVSGFPGDPPDHHGLADWYRPHIEAWSRRASPVTTLWFWCTEVGWASVHPVFEGLGWEYMGCNIWDKGIAHIAGNCNTKTMRRFPAVTEVCVQYTKPATFDIGNGHAISMKEWLRREWQRTGLPLYKTNEACGVRNAASRKYFTQCHFWYFPPVEAMARLVAYANEHGTPSGRPYFSLDGERSLTGGEWGRMRGKFDLQAGITNVWQEPALRNSERIKVDRSLGHPNQKPLKLMRRIIQAASDPGDVVWEPFGGLCSASVAALETGRLPFAAEINASYFELAKKRLTEAAK